MSGWQCKLELDEQRSIVKGSEAALCKAIRKGADLRIGTEFRYNEHTDVSSLRTDLLREVVDFRITYLLDDCWTAGICSLRAPAKVSGEFGPRPSMSFFLYNQNGQQAIARPYLDGQSSTGPLGPSPVVDDKSMPKNHDLSCWDQQTNAPSSNFIYDFDHFRFYVYDRWEQVLSHQADGTITSGSVEDLAEAFSSGCEIKVGIAGLCADLAESESETLDHEVFVHLGSCYYYIEDKIFLGQTHPLVRTRPAIPLAYKSQSWDFGWLLPHTDGRVAGWIRNPYTLKFSKNQGHYPIRWFVGN